MKEKYDFSDSESTRMPYGMVRTEVITPKKISKIPLYSPEHMARKNIIKTSVSVTGKGADNFLHSREKKSRGVIRTPVKMDEA